MSNNNDQEDAERLEGIDLLAHNLKNESIDQEDVERLEGIDLYREDSNSTENSDTPIDPNTQKINLMEERLTPNSGLKFDLEETRDLKSKLQDLYNEKEYIIGIINGACDSLEELNEDTKLEFKNLYPISDLRGTLLGQAGGWFDTLGALIDEVQNIMNGTEATDKDDEGSGENQIISTIPLGGGSSSSSSGGSSSSSSSEVTNIEAGVVDSNISLLGAVVGTITFTEILPLYNEIGGVSNASSSLTGDYGLIGIFFKDGQYYYKILDKNTNEAYYVLANDKVNIQTDFTEIAEIKEPAMMLNSTEIGTNNFVKLADSNSFYFVQDKVQNSDITFLNVLDGTDGNSYYIPLSDEVGLTSLETITANIVGSK